MDQETNGESSLESAVRELISLSPRAVPWESFKAEVFPSFTPPLVSAERGNKIRRLIREIEAIDLADEGDPPRFIASTADLTVKLVSRYVASRPPKESPFTLKGRLIDLQTLCTRAHKRRYLALSPFEEVPIYRIVRTGRPKKTGALTRDQIRRLFEVLKGDVAYRKGWAGWKSRRLLAAFTVAIYTGLRRQELLTLQADDIDLAARVIRLMPRGERGKGLKTDGSSKAVGIPMAALPLIREWLARRMDAPAGFAIDPECPWFLPTCSRRGPWVGGITKKRALGRLQSAARRAGIEHVTWQMCRASLGTHMECFGASPAQVQRQLRHSQSTVTEVFYRKVDEKNAADAVKDVEF